LASGRSAAFPPRDGGGMGGPPGPAPCFLQAWPVPVAAQAASCGAGANFPAEAEQVAARGWEGSSRNWPAGSIGCSRAGAQRARGGRPAAGSGREPELPEHLQLDRDVATVRADGDAVCGTGAATSGGRRGRRGPRHLACLLALSRILRYKAVPVHAWSG
jgi:hypothetical protein